MAEDNIFADFVHPGRLRNRLFFSAFRRAIVRFRDAVSARGGAIGPAAN
jgi:hypothetical protein